MVMVPPDWNELRNLVADMLFIDPVEAERLERYTVAFEHSEGTEYLLGTNGGILYVPHEEF